VDAVGRNVKDGVGESWEEGEKRVEKEGLKVEAGVSEEVGKSVGEGEGVPDCIEEELLVSDGEVVREAPSRPPDFVTLGVCVDVPDIVRLKVRGGVGVGVLEGQEVELGVSVEEIVEVPVRDEKKEEVGETE